MSKVWQYRYHFLSIIHVDTIELVDISETIHTNTEKKNWERKGEKQHFRFDSSGYNVCLRFRALFLKKKNKQTKVVYNTDPPDIHSYVSCISVCIIEYYIELVSEQPQLVIVAAVLVCLIFMCRSIICITPNKLH